MKFERLRARGMGEFKGEIDVDISALPGKLVAITGGNGSGKTTLLGLLMGAITREVPTRGTLAKLAKARDSYVEATVVNGARHVVRQLVDGVSGKGETSIVNDAGEAVVASGKVKDADRWLAEHLPSPDVVFASQFAIQGRRGVFDLSRSERMQVVNRALGIERLERLAMAAAEHAAGVKTECGVLSARLADLPLVDMATLTAAAIARAEELACAEQRTKDARLGLDRAKAAAEDAGRRADLIAQRQAAEQRHKAAKEALDDIDTRIANNRALLARKEEIEGAEKLATELDAQLAGAREAVAGAQAKLAAARAASTAADNAVLAARRAEPEAKARLERAERRLVDRPKVLAAQGELEELRARERVVADLETAGAAHVAELEQLVLAGKDQRITGLRKTLDTIGHHEDGDAPFQAWALSGLREDYDLGERLKAAPTDLAVRRGEVAVWRAELRELAAQIQAKAVLAARAAEIEAAERDRAAAEGEVVAAAEVVRRTLETAVVAADNASSDEKADGEARATVLRLENQRGALAELLKQLPHLQQAAARLEERTQQRVGAVAALESAAAELATLPEAHAETVDVAGAERAVTEAAQREGLARDTASRTNAAVEQGQETLGKREELSARLAAKQAEHADWIRLAQDSGRDGLQAMEIDAVVPTLNELTNQLLHEALGTRFTVEWRTTRLSADGKRAIEDLEINVIDTLKGRDAEAETYSGGELVVVGEAVALALTVVSCRKSGAEGVTLVRDESSAALDQENGRAWVSMMRRAAELLGADKVLYVSHVPELQAMADCRLHLEDGRVEVRT